MKLVFYGAGNMAQAIFTGIINSNNLNANDIYLTNVLIFVDAGKTGWRDPMNKH